MLKAGLITENNSQGINVNVQNNEINSGVNGNANVINSQNNDMRESSSNNISNQNNNPLTLQN